MSGAMLSNNKSESLMPIAQLSDLIKWAEMISFSVQNQLTMIMLKKALLKCFKTTLTCRAISTYRKTSTLSRLKAEIRLPNRWHTSSNLSIRLCMKTTNLNNRWTKRFCICNRQPQDQLKKSFKILDKTWIKSWPEKTKYFTVIIFQTQKMSTT